MLSNYTLGSTDAEHQRLIHLAQHEEEVVADACRRAGIGAGATVVDLGCGPLGALGALARVVGPFRVESHRAYAVHYPPAIGYDIPPLASSSAED